MMDRHVQLGRTADGNETGGKVAGNYENGGF